MRERGDRDAFRLVRDRAGADGDRRVRQRGPGRPDGRLAMGWLLGVAFVVLIVAVVLNYRRHGESHAPAGDWARTDEVFRDPSHGPADARVARSWRRPSLRSGPTDEQSFERAQAWIDEVAERFEHRSTSASSRRSAGDPGRPPGSPRRRRARTARDSLLGVGPDPDVHEAAAGRQSGSDRTGSPASSAPAMTCRSAPRRGRMFSRADLRDDVEPALRDEARAPGAFRFPAGGRWRASRGVGGRTRTAPPGPSTP